MLWLRAYGPGDWPWGLRDWPWGYRDWETGGEDVWLGVLTVCPWIVGSGAGAGLTQQLGSWPVQRPGGLTKGPRSLDHISGALFQRLGGTAQ